MAEDDPHEDDEHGQGVASQDDDSHDAEVSNGKSPRIDLNRVWAVVGGFAVAATLVGFGLGLTVLSGGSEPESSTEDTTESQDAATETPSSPGRSESADPAGADSSDEDSLPEETEGSQFRLRVDCPEPTAVPGQTLVLGFDYTLTGQPIAASFGASLFHPDSNEAQDDDENNLTDQPLDVGSGFAEIRFVIPSSVEPSGVPYELSGIVYEGAETGAGEALVSGDCPLTIRSSPLTTGQILDTVDARFEYPMHGASAGIAESEQAPYLDSVSGKIASPQGPEPASPDLQLWLVSEGSSEPNTYRPAERVEWADDGRWSMDGMWLFDPGTESKYQIDLILVVADNQAGQVLADFATDGRPLPNGLQGVQELSRITVYCCAS